MWRTFLCLTIQIRHDTRWRDGCEAAGVTVRVVVCNAWFGAVVLFLLALEFICILGGHIFLCDDGECESCADGDKKWGDQVFISERFELHKGIRNQNNDRDDRDENADISNRG